MTAKEYLKQAYLLDKQIQVEVKELEQLREMRGTIQGCSYGEKIGTNPNRNLEAPFIKTTEKIWDYEQRIDAQINRLVDLRSEINEAIENCLLSTEENIHPSLVGLVVDYLTRFMLGKTASEAFEISLSEKRELGRYLLRA